jgi:hypothetical protein
MRHQEGIARKTEVFRDKLEGRLAEMVRLDVHPVQADRRAFHVGGRGGVREFQEKDREVGQRCQQQKNRLNALYHAKIRFAPNLQLKQQL